MSYLLAIAVGPVQEFIAAARRTRDLWFGSYLLSEISRAVAKSIEDSIKANGGKLIFPSSVGAENVANVILARLDSDDPKGVAAIAKEAAQDRWIKFAKDAREQVGSDILQNVWNDQVNDVIEFYAAWVIHEHQNYAEDRNKLMRLLAGRKNCRDFLPAHGRALLPKSSLDGQRETVLHDRLEWSRESIARLRIRKGEQLDVVGLVKRVFGGNIPYPSVSRIAADPWVRGNSGRLQQLISACEQLGDQVVRRINLDKERGHPHFRDFPYEGGAVYVNRHHELIEETGATAKDLEGLNKALRCLPPPDPYLAVLVADGDKMGAAISGMYTIEKHQNFSKALAGFATSAKSIVNSNNGVLIYAGGDDVLAFLPVDKCLKCARELRNKFVECLTEQVPSNTPTLSVGIAIGHFLENLEDLLNQGRDAEKAAKKVRVKRENSKEYDEKDAIAVHLHKRGGAPIKIASRWETNPEERLLKFAKLMNDGIIPTKLPYELRTMAALYEGWSDANIDLVIQKDLYRLIAKKTSRGLATVREALSEYIKEMNSSKLIILAQELLVARQIATALRQADRRLVSEGVTL